MATKKQPRKVSKSSPKTKRKSTPSARSTRSIFKPRLAHPKHSFRLLPRAHTDYPTLAFIMLLVGIFTWGWTAYAVGDSYQVNAVVPAPPLPTAAVITSPVDGATIVNEPIIVDGTCPPNSYVKLYRNNVFSGVSICQADNTWHIQTDLFNGTNALSAIDYNVTDQPGPTSAIVTVVYEPPASPVSTGSNITEPTKTEPKTSSNSRTTVAPLILGSDFLYKGYNDQELTDWALTISGGTAPYAISVDWGDGVNNLISQQQAGGFDLQHTYTQTGKDYHYSYTIIIKASDAAGQSSLLQLLTLVTPRGGAIGKTQQTAGGMPAVSSPYHTFLSAATPAYGVALLILASFWLGERRESRLLKPKLRRPAH